MKYYYNYAVITPFYDDISLSQEPRALKNEKAYPGYYSAEIGDIFCEMTVSGGVAYHRYTFGRDNGRIAVDFSNKGLSKEFGEAYWSEVKNPDIEILENDQVSFAGEFSGVKLYFFVLAESKTAQAALFEGKVEKNTRSAIPLESPYGVVFDFSEDTASLKVGYSTISAERAREEVMAASLSFDEAREAASEIWNEHLSAIRIESDDE